MPSKRMLIAALVLLNVVLLTAVLLSSYTPPMAIAQMAEDNEEMAPAPASPGRRPSSSPSRPTQVTTSSTSSTRET